MVITRVYLSHFRNFKKAEFTFNPHLTLIVGENAKGKTSLLEAVYTAIYGTGFRESRELELLTWEHEQGIVESEFTDRDVKTLFQIKLQI